MLTKITKNEFDRYVDFAYDLAMDLTKTSFPLYTTGIMGKSDFINRSKKALKSDREEILLFIKNNIVEGWIGYYFINEDKYIGISSILVRNGYDEALEELLIYWKQHFLGYKWDIYFPEENKTALTYMQSKGYLEKSKEVVDVLFFNNYNLRAEDNHIISINKNNFDYFRKLHSKCEEGMYWTSNKMLESIGDWEIFVYVEGNKPLAAIYYTSYGNKDLEIFGIDTVDKEYDSEIIKALMISCLNKGKVNGARSMLFFNDKQIHEVIEKLGFNTETVAHYFSEEC